MNPVRPICYTLYLEPDLGRFCFSGKVEIEIEPRRPVSHVSLNILELAVWSCALKTGDKIMVCSFEVDPKEESLKIHLPEPMDEVFCLTVEYQGLINEKMAGFYRSTFKDNGKQPGCCGS